VHDHHHYLLMLYDKVLNYAYDKHNL